MPVVVIAAFAIDAATGGNDHPSAAPSGPLPAISASAPPNITAEAAACTKVLEKLPVQLNRLQPRVVHTSPETPFVVAWGNPAIMLRCGVARPKSLHPGSAAQYFDGGDINGPYFDVTSSDGANIYTSVDRAAYISVTVPAKYQGATALPPLATAIATALPPVCSVPDSNGNHGSLPLCTHRP